MARHQRMPTTEAEYTYAVAPCLSSSECLQRGGVHIRPFAKCVCCRNSE